MADEEQLRILKQGVEAWNAWRQQAEKETLIDLSEANLSGANLRRVDLSEANLRSEHNGRYGKSPRRRNTWPTRNSSAS